MSGIGPINAYAAAGNEAVKKDKTQRRRSSGGTSQTLDRVEGAVQVEDLQASRLIEMARDALETKEPVRQELLSVIQRKLEAGDYENREMLEALADRLLLLFEEGRSS